jgi:uncharacterized protein (TIGR02147 family)
MFTDYLSVRMFVDTALLTVENELNPRLVLMEELEKRCRANPKYSLRGFARALGMSPSGLSLVLSGQRGFSKKAAEKIAAKLGFDPKKTKFFTQSAVKRGTRPAQLNTSQIELDQFATIAEWYHFAILSLIDTKDFVPKVQWIASRLDISIAETKSALRRLTALGILDTTTPSWKQIGAPIFLKNEASTAATRLHQKHTLEKAIYSLENDPFSEREHNSVTMAIHPKHVSYARKKIREFLMDLMSDLEKKGEAQEVYNLSVQLYPTTRRKNQ